MTSGGYSIFLCVILSVRLHRHCSAETLHHSANLLSSSEGISRQISVLEDISVDECVDSCRLRLRCDGVSYQRLANVCFLFQDGDDAAGFNYVRQKNYVSGLKSEWDVKVRISVRSMWLLLMS